MRAYSSQPHELPSPFKACYLTRMSGTTARRPAATGSSASSASRYRSAPPAADVEVIPLVDAFLRGLGLAWVRVAAELDRRRGLPAGVPRRAGRLPLRRTAPASPTSPRAVRGVPAAGARLQGRAVPRRRRGGTADPRSPVRRRAGCTSTRCGRACRRRALAVLDPRLVRGLDYYTRTAFEFVRRGSRARAVGSGRRRALRRAR